MNESPVGKTHGRVGKNRGGLRQGEGNILSSHFKASEFRQSRSLRDCTSRGDNGAAAGRGIT